MGVLLWNGKVRWPTALAMVYAFGMLAGCTQLNFPCELPCNAACCAQPRCAGELVFGCTAPHCS